MRALLRPLVLLCLLATACTGGAPPPAVAQDQPLTIKSSSLPFKIDEPAAKAIGPLRWRGGIEMTAKDRHFGGWSDLHVSPDGRSLTSISDEGAWLTATIELDEQGNLKGLGNARLGQLLGLDGKFIQTKPEADSEAMAQLADGSWLVAFERNHRIWHYPTLTSIPVPVAGPADIGRQPENGGIEAMTVLADGRVITISEEYSERPGWNVGWIGQPQPGSKPGERYQWSKFSYATIADFHPTAIVRLPDGSFATLERAFDMVRGVRIRVMRFPAEKLVAGGSVKAEELARLASPYAVDNLEGLSATVGARGETLLWLISDDNFNPLQRNMLLQFELTK